MRFSTFASTALLPIAYAQIANYSVPPVCNEIQVITTCGTYQNGYGTLQGLTDNVVALFSNASSVSLTYPANTSPYYLSVANGVKNLTAYIQYFVDACPDTNIVLLGYSQGAQVSLSTLCGWPGGLFGFGSVDGLASKYQDRVLAVVGYGDPTHVYPNAIDRGNSTHNGEFPRPSAACNFISTKIASWCDNGDQFCDACLPPINDQVPNPRGCNADVHESYWNIYNPDAVAWVQQRYNEVYPTSNNITSSAPVPTTTATPTTTLGTTTSGALTNTLTTTTTSASGTAAATSTSGASLRVQPPALARALLRVQ